MCHRHVGATSGPPPDPTQARPRLTESNFDSWGHSALGTLASATVPRRVVTAAAPRDYAGEERSVDDCQIFRGELSVSARHDFVLNLLAFVEAVQPRAFNSGDVDKNILAAVVGLDEPKSLA